MISLNIRPNHLSKNIRPNYNNAQVAKLDKYVFPSNYSFDPQPSPQVFKMS